MNTADNPIRDLHDALAHAEYEGFNPIKYMKTDFEALREAKTPDERQAAMQALPAERRPTATDIEVYAMFTQTWGSTALGHGGIGGSAMTTAYTIVLECYATKEFLVYFGGRICYKVVDPSTEFFQDIADRCMVSGRDASDRY